MNHILQSNMYGSDDSLFHPDLYTLLSYNSKENILAFINQKHDMEILEDYSHTTKQHDLIIWNAMFTKIAAERGIVKEHLADLYNNFYQHILASPSLKDLQKIELNMASKYLNVLIYQIEVYDNYVLNRIMIYLHLHIEEPFHLEDMAQELNLSVGYISKCFKDYHHQSIMSYARQLKIERGQVLLKTTQQTVHEIGLTLGFHDQSHFNRTFKKIAGMTPLQYRNEG